MRWVWLAISVSSGTIGDLWSAKGMAIHGEIDDFGPHGLARIMRYILTHRLLIVGIVGNAVSFFSLMALLSVSELSFAVPASAMSYILKTALARWYLSEDVTVRRWLGAACVAIGIALISM
jgi:drug/metabolite transporter (DMT)-like permease